MPPPSFSLKTTKTIDSVRVRKNKPNPRDIHIYKYLLELRCEPSHATGKVQPHAETVSTYNETSATHMLQIILKSK